MKYALNCRPLKAASPGSGGVFSRGLWNRAGRAKLTAHIDSEASLAKNFD
jgi:hypothetical protein